MPRLILLVIAAAFSTAAAADDRAARLAVAYSRYVEVFEADFEKNVAMGLEAARSRGKLNEETEPLLRAFLQNLDFQKIIDEMVCLERDARALIECSKARRQDTVEMWQFWEQYDLNADVHKPCEMKSRLLQFENRYPPARYLLAGRKEFDRPKAIDAKSYMGCVKARL